MCHPERSNKLSMRNWEHSQFVNRLPDTLVQMHMCELTVRGCERRGTIPTIHLFHEFQNAISTCYPGYEHHAFRTA